MLTDRFYEPSALRDIAADHRSAGLNEVDVAMMDLAGKVAEDATSVTQADVQRLRGLGLDALGVEADAALAEFEPGLREVLTVGRPIASG